MMPRLHQPHRTGRGAANSLRPARRATVSTKNRILIYLTLLAILDAVIPIPITVLILIMVINQKPIWFKAWVEEVYRS